MPRKPSLLSFVSTCSRNPLCLSITRNLPVVCRASSSGFDVWFSASGLYVLYDVTYVFFSSFPPTRPFRLAVMRCALRLQPGDDYRYDLAGFQACENLLSKKWMKRGDETCTFLHYVRSSPSLPRNMQFTRRSLFLLVVVFRHEPSAGAASFVEVLE